MNFARSVLEIGLLLMAVGCTTTRPLPNHDTGLVALPIELQDYAGQPTDKGPRDAQLWLGAISGEVYGTTKAEFKTLDIGGSATVAVPMAELEKFATKSATRLTSTAVAAGFTIAPADARLVRIATGFISKEPEWHSAYTNLADSLTKRTLVLMYFDRPCRLSGAVITQLSSGGARTDYYDVVIEKAGLNWMETTKVGEDSHLDSRHAPASARPVLTVKAKEKSG